ncbi:sensor histidine kinase [Microlunatus sp. Y2014]|uniref:sensor histidine kinase n=1 Tax=Microlunatus sp. Y2014 TaxID=3418488 RepID=UPI003DA78A8E
MARRGMLTLASLVLTVVTMIGLVPFVLSVVSIPLFVVWVGIPMFLGSTLLTRAWSNGGRWLAGSILGEPVARPYRAVPAGTGFFGRVRIWLTDPATWRDLLWLLVSCTAGFTIAVLVLTFAAGTLFYLAQPLLLYLTPPGIFDDPFGGLVHLSHWTHGFFMWPLAALVFGLWWATTPALMKAWAHMARALLAPTRAAVLAGQVASLSSSRAETRDSAAAELRRIERDLHDGVQVKLASLGMSLGLIEQLMVDDPERARAMLAEASTATTGTMEDLRSLVRGIHPPVLADRGLVGAVEALTLDVSVPVSFTVTGCTHPDGEPIRFDAPVESCLYFGIAESLANVVKHSGATRATVTLVRRNDRLVATVSDNGRGGAEPAGGSGLTGLERRLRAFDGSLQIDSPVGGPTTISMEVPCETPASEHSSPRTTPSSARG